MKSKAHKCILPENVHKITIITSVDGRCLSFHKTVKQIGVKFIGDELRSRTHSNVVFHNRETFQLIEFVWTDRLSEGKIL